MIQDFAIDIKNISPEEKQYREKNLELFNKEGFPNKRLEAWKFTDLNKIIEDNFKNLKANNKLEEYQEVELLKDFEHNYIVLINGVLKSNNFKYEDQKKFKLKEYDENINNQLEIKNSLINLNNALFKGGYSLEVSDNYSFKKPLVIYNYFLNNLENKIVNNKNTIFLNKNSRLDLIEFNSDISKNNFIYNNYTNIRLEENAFLKSYNLQGCKSNGFFYKFLKVCLTKMSNYEDYIFSSGLKFNKVEEDVNIIGENAKCNIQSALSLNFNEHQEIKTQINHLKPNCISYQKIKNVLNKNCKGAYQGKIFVKDVAQKTDAYQLSKALLLDNSSEFNAKPELEIYADDVKCSHGSTSGSVNEDSIYYLMTRGISRKNAVGLLTKAFLFEIANSIKNEKIKVFIEKNLDRQIYGH
jgi:Fe-S cluster assembly protein SufD